MSGARLRKMTVQWTNVAMLATALALLAGFFGSFHPAFDSLAHFRAHLAVLAALLALPMLATGHRLPALSVLMFAAVAFSTTSNALSFLGLGRVEAGLAATPPDRATYRLLQMNLLYNNPTPEKVLSLIGRTKPDVVTVEEVSEMWRGKLGLLAAAYPHSVFCPYPNGFFGVAILSRRPFVEGTQPQCFGRGALAIAKVDFAGTPVDVAALHLGWPWPFRQARQITAMSAQFETLSETAIMAGDCNAAPWSAAVQRVAELGGLKVVPSIGPSWLHIRLPEFLRFAGLPIDQVFSKGAILIHQTQRLESTGSDHLPVQVDFSIRPGEREPDSERASAIAAAWPELPPSL
ncbi:endonuclease/exonuclease/phosphatase (EEP) superfamily protein YafD [Aquamicrobium terrae]